MDALTSNMTSALVKDDDAGLYEMRVVPNKERLSTRAWETHARVMPDADSALSEQASWMGLPRRGIVPPIAACKRKLLASGTGRT